jgi:DNA adenine methylase
MLTAMAPWFGAKRTLAKRICNEIGPHGMYVEPFCGSCAVLFAKKVCSHEIVNDLHDQLINLARVLASDRYGELMDRIERTLYAEAVHAEARQYIRAGELPVAPSIVDVEPEHVLAAYWFLIYSWQSRNGAAGTNDSQHTFGVNYKCSNGTCVRRWEKVAPSIQTWHARLKNVQIISVDALELIERTGDQKGTVIYCDPPYFKKSQKYIHDFAIEDHLRLFELLDRFKKARVLVSYYHHPEIDAMYRDWNHVDMSFSSVFGNRSRKGGFHGKIAPEVLWIKNGPAFTSEPKLF